MTPRTRTDSTDVLGQRSAVRALSIQRLLATVVFTAIIVVQHGGAPDGLYIVAPIAMAWEIVTFALLRGPGWQRISVFWLIVADLVILCVGIFISGRSHSDLLLPSLIVIPATAFTFSTRQVVEELASLVIVAGLIPILADVSNHVHAAGHHLVLFLLAGALALVVVTVFARVSNDITGRLAELSLERRDLLVERIARDDAARAQISQELHDEALQALLAVSQDLDEAIEGDSVSLDAGRATVQRAIESLSRAVQRLHPESLAGAELGITLPALLEYSRAHHGVSGEARVDPGLVARRDERIYRVAHELVDNACRHAGASRIDVSLEEAADDVVLRVIDDGIGYAPPARAALVASGRIGLASAVEQVESAGGSLAFRPGPGGTGTEARVRLPR